jgi:hypothetical protein
MFEWLTEPIGAALVAGAVHFLIGAAWYSPAGFARPWMRGLGITPADIAEARVDMRAALGASALASFAQAGVLVALFAMLGLPGVAGGALIGGLVGFAFGALPMVKDRVWADRAWPVVLVDGGYETVAGGVAGGVAAALMGMA